MSQENRKNLLHYLIFIKENVYADCESQQEYTTKEETSLPTMSLEAMMMFCAIDAN